jgi:hypothetical protein
MQTASNEGRNYPARREERRVKPLLSALLFAGYVFAAQPALADPAPTIVPPTGWTAKPFTMDMQKAHMLGMWLSPTAHDGFSETVNLMTEASSLSFADYLAASRSAVLASLAKSIAVDADEPCTPGTTAHRFEYVATFGPRNYQIVQLARMSGGAAYIATYTRLPDSPADPDVLASLKSLCSDATSTIKS